MWQVNHLIFRLHQHKGFAARKDGRKTQVMDRLPSLKVSHNSVVVPSNWKVDNVIIDVGLAENVLGVVNHCNCPLYEILQVIKLNQNPNMIQ